MLLGAGALQLGFLRGLVAAACGQRGLNELALILRQDRGVLALRPGLPHHGLRGQQALWFPSALIPEPRRHVDPPPNQQRGLFLRDPATQPVPAGQQGLMSDAQLVLPEAEET